MARTLGVLVAGGRGERLGLGAPKALARLGGRTLLERQLATLAAVCDDIVVSAPATLALPLPASMRADDAADAAGPLAGLVAGLQARPFVRALVLAVDLPGATPSALAQLGRELGGHPAAIAGAGRELQPLLGAYAPASLAPLAASLAAGERALVRAVLALGPIIVPAHTLGDAVRLMLNLNTPADAIEAERHLAGGDAA